MDISQLTEEEKAQLRAELGTPTAPAPPAPPQPVVTADPAPPAPVTMPAETATTESTAVAEELPEEWPVKGYTGPQPWQVSRPPAITHNRGILIAGSAGDEVLELAACLARIGYETSISRGENANAVYGGAEREAVAAFHRDYGIEEDPAIIAASTSDAVGPWSWEALFRLVRRAEEAA